MLRSVIVAFALLALVGCSSTVTSKSAPFMLDSSGNTVKVNGAYVTPAMFDNDSAKLFLGRRFAQEEYSASPRVVILSHAAWEHRFHSDAARTIGHTVRLDGKDHVIVGVMSPGFETPTEAEFLLPQRHLAN